MFLLFQVPPVVLLCPVDSWVYALWGGVRDVVSCFVFTGDVVRQTARPSSGQPRLTRTR